MKDEAARAELIARVAAEHGVPISPRAALLAPLPLKGPWNRYCSKGCGNRVHVSSTLDVCRDCRRHDREAVHPRPPWSPKPAPAYGGAALAPSPAPAVSPSVERPMARVVSLSRRRKKQILEQAKFEREAPLREALRTMQAAPHTVPSCRALWAGVLVQGIVDFEGRGFYNKGDSGEEYQARAYGKHLAADWFESRLGYVGSFEWICGQLDVDADVLREKLFSGSYVRPHLRTKDRRSMRGLA